MKKLLLAAIVALACTGCHGNGPSGAGQPTHTSVVPSCYPNCLPS